MDFAALRANAMSRLQPISRKRARGAVAILNAAPYRIPFFAKPELIARWVTAMQIRADRQVRRYSPHDPNRLPR